MANSTKGYRVTQASKLIFERFLHTQGGKISDHISRGVALLEADKGRTLARAVVASGAGQRGSKSSHKAGGTRLGSTWTTIATVFPPILILRINNLAKIHGCAAGAVVEAAINKVVSYPKNPEAIRDLCGKLNRNETISLLSSLPSNGGGALPQREANVFADHSVFAAALFKGITSARTEARAVRFIDRVLAQKMHAYTNTYELSLLMEMLSVSGNEEAIPTVANFFIVYCPAFPVFEDAMAIAIKDRRHLGAPLGARLAYQTVATARMGAMLLTATPSSYSHLITDEWVPSATSMDVWGI